MSAHSLPLIVLPILGVSFLSGCASLATPSPDVQPQASLRQPCPNLQPPADGRAGTILSWSIEAVRLYRECQSRHARLAEATASK